MQNIQYNNYCITTQSTKINCIKIQTTNNFLENIKEYELVNVIKISIVIKLVSFPITQKNKFLLQKSYFLAI